MRRGTANGGLAGLRCTCDIANSMLMKASTRDIMTSPRLLVSAPELVEVSTGTFGQVT